MCGAAGWVTSHSRTVWSALPAAKVCPSGLNATEYTVLEGPVNGRPSRIGWLGLVTSHRRTVLSPPAAARVRPSGLNATEYTSLVGPVNVASARDCPGVLTSHSRTAWSLLPAASVRRSGLSATDCTTPRGPRMRVAGIMAEESSKPERASLVGEIW